MTSKPSAPAPAKKDAGKQMDDNIDELGRKPDGSKLDQPGATKPPKK